MSLNRRSGRGRCAMVGYGLLPEKLHGGGGVEGIPLVALARGDGRPGEAAHAPGQAGDEGLQQDINPAVQLSSCPALQLSSCPASRSPVMRTSIFALCSRAP
jgi:hypothetical protein